MAFHGPVRADYDNVAALNAAYLRLLGKDPRLRSGLGRLPEPLRERIVGLRAGEIRRLAATPLLLFSYHEREVDHWHRVLAAGDREDLFPAATGDELDTLNSAALGFIWQLARQNAYALRLVTGATLYWCEQIAEVTFLKLLRAVAVANEVPALRFSTRHELWRKLLTAGVSRTTKLRRAAQMGALQAGLTEPEGGRRERLPVAEQRVPDRSRTISGAPR